MCVHAAHMYMLPLPFSKILIHLCRRKMVFSRNNAICEYNSLRYGVLIICYSIFIR